MHEGRGLKAPEGGTVRVRAGQRMNTFATKSSSCCVAGTSGRRITREEVITLRKITVAKRTWIHKIARTFHNCFNAIKTGLLAPIQNAKRDNSMCKFYGHVIQGSWEGYYPRCGDCGCEIHTPDQLRKASPNKSLIR